MIVALKATPLLPGEDKFDYWIVCQEQAGNPGEDTLEAWHIEGMSHPLVNEETVEAALAASDDWDESASVYGQDAGDGLYTEFTSDLTIAALNALYEDMTVTAVPSECGSDTTAGSVWVSDLTTAAAIDPLLVIEEKDEDVD